MKDKREDYLYALQRVFKSEDGVRILKHWVANYVDTSVVSKELHIMTYLTGQKELIQSIQAEVNMDIDKAMEVVKTDDSTI